MSGSGSDVTAVAESRVLRRGDKVEIALLGIPGSQILNDKVDGQGYVNLPHIGKVRLEGTTPSEAKVLIQRAYIDGGIYRRIDVGVVPEAYSYYISGEVARPGKYEWSTDMTLLRAIAAAGDYTEYARRSRVDVTRGGEKTTYNTDKIEDLRIPDPPIKPNDTIKVNRRIL
jgi:polysaccharide export outer membrane protein